MDLVTTETIPADSPQPRIKRRSRSYLRDYACNKKSPPPQALGQFHRRSGQSYASWAVRNARSLVGKSSGNLHDEDEEGQE